ncbi:RNA polymerase sigma factor, sigma-70 family [Desulfitobacterium dehalogenans ATCC 51507]|uniref:RNA polymerase sigma factor, sigma-70 family n=1 Tax=Desulfitobacterium dehalogenans (strain ATCC 51507 / DSM 9161 / JW/IU-DC1) TaxID=756499 RepID=I4A648_DESDJ|nr:RNA polymerase sigma factor [Desulfitobacterium dehalogenans]AFL99432.1 RNA polymerase sigma factor, sigma-70 family [Desulfitobacterium dehalogenans ATCC 51507]
MESKTGPPPSTMESWYRETVTKLYRFIYSQLQSKEETEDITQETYLRCLKQDSGNLPPYAYLKQIARNLMTDRYRHKLVAQNHLEHLPEPEYPSPEEEWLNRSTLHELMNQLPSDYRQILEYRIIQGYSRKETATLMGRSESSIRGLQYRALQTLRSYIHSYQQKGGDL